MPITEKELAFLKRWNWENMPDGHGEAFALADSRGFPYTKMAWLVFLAAKARLITGTPVEPPPMVEWPWPAMTFEEVKARLEP